VWREHETSTSADLPEKVDAVVKNVNEPPKFVKPFY